jgi:hypothetical protein
VLRLHPDTAGVVRYATIRTASGHESRRAVAHLVPLERDGPAAGTTPTVAETGQPTDASDLSARDLRALRRQAIRDS